jgi:carbon storage regulator
MLVLSRKVGERILIGDNIAVTVVRVAQGMVRLGVEAPQELSIVREEIKDRRKPGVEGSGFRVQGSGASSKGLVPES